MKYLVILSDELGEEFSVEIDAPNESDAVETIAIDYPESGIVAVTPIRRYKKGDME